MDKKNLVAEYAKTKGFKAAINVGAGWYLENHFVPEVAGLLGGLPSTQDVDDYLTLTVPNWGGDETIPFNSITDDHSDIVHGVLLDPEAYNGKDIQGVRNLATPEQLVRAVEKATGKKSRFVEIKDWTTTIDNLWKPRD
ncbi:hypothetical protein C2857_003129 [Epichloe festucae Fl1]|uniref:NmrA-like domain-containing protein n=1 Tax=Epichloe festucae (strain Fl1) TaxID=877507 RepID=A0A7S9KUN4_EPIFF|nr:hypothetical protein C2857_003129 [Epichloe festucae Fl1]